MQVQWGNRCFHQATASHKVRRSWVGDMRATGEKELFGRLRATGVPCAMVVIILLLRWSNRLPLTEDHVGGCLRARVTGRQTETWSETESARRARPSCMINA